MKVATEKTAVIKQIKQLDDLELLQAIKGLVDFGLRKQNENSIYNIPERHKKLVRGRIKNTPREQYLNWDKAKDGFKSL